MNNYNPTPQLEKAIREYLHESIVPLIEQVLVKKLGQAMSFAAEQLIQPKREWASLSDEEHYTLADKAGCMSADWVEFAKSIEQALKEKNT
jgi:hypothetical protein